MFQEVCLALVVLIITYFILSWIMTTKDMPPCPNPLPILGNLIDVVRWTRGTAMQLELTKIAQMFQGKAFTLKIPGMNIVVVNSISTAREVLLTRKDDFAGRPYLFAHDYLHRGMKDIVSQDFGTNLILQRKIVYSAIRKYQPNLENRVNKEVEELIKRLKAHQQQPIDPLPEMMLTTLNVICAMVYGERYEINDPEFKKIIEYNQKMFSVVGPFNILNIFPLLIHTPIQDSKMIKYVINTRDGILNKKFHEHQQTYKDGVIRDLTDALIKALQEAEQEDSKTRDIITEDHVVMTMSDAFSAGFETITTTSMWFFLLMACYPEVQAKVQNELDTIIGRDNMPTYNDKSRLPYLSAAIEETQRFGSIVPLLNVHKATKDSTLEGFKIPKGTSIIINSWAMHYDEKEWKDPQVFNPGRFIDADGKLMQSAGMKSFLPFGAGRRVCVGETLAKQELFLITSRLLHQFTVIPEVPGSPPTLEGDFKTAIHSPKPYKVCFKHRK